MLQPFQTQAYRGLFVVESKSKLKKEKTVTRISPFSRFSIRCVKKENSQETTEFTVILILFH
jgi:hypothetical protein